MSMLTYNSVSLPLPYSTTFRQEAIYEDSQTDWFCTRFVIGVRCVLNTNYLSVNGGALTSPAQLMNVLRSLLLKPRKKLSFIVGGIEMIPTLVDIPGTVDAQNGPRPQYCNISQITNTSFLLDYSIIAHYWENHLLTGNAASVSGNSVLYNRWTETVELNEFIRARRIRDGEIRLRSDNNAGVTVDNLRKFAELSVPYNFIRESSKFTATKDGLGLQYRIVDREVYKMPPSPAFKAEGDFTVQIIGTQRQYKQLSAWVRLYGSNWVDQNDLIFAATFIVNNKMQVNLGAPVTGGPVIDSITNGTPTVNPLKTDWILKVWMYDNIVEFHSTALANNTVARFLDLPGFANNPQVYTPGSDTVDPALNMPQYTYYGTSNLFTHAAAYNDPSNTTTTNLIASTNTTNTNPFVTGTPFAGGAPREQMPGIEPGKAGTISEP